MVGAFNRTIIRFIFRNGFTGIRQQAATPLLAESAPRFMTIYCGPGRKLILRDILVCLNGGRSYDLPC